MFLLESNIIDIINEFDLVKEWINVVESSILKEKIDLSKVYAYYTYGFFTTKSKNTIDALQEMMDSALKMKFDERLDFERSKVRVDVSFKIGNFLMSNRLPTGSIPKFIDELVTEIVKVRMTIESEMDYRQEIAESIPPLTGLVSLEFFDKIMEIESEEDDVLNIDEILDKISNEGMESLTAEEKEFLDKKSKDV